MKYLINGAIGDVYTNSGSYSGATIVEVNDSFIEFEDSDGVRRAAGIGQFSGFDFSSHGIPLTQKMRVGAVLTAGTVALTVTGFGRNLVEYTTPDGSAHVMIGWSVFPVS